MKGQLRLGALLCAGALSFSAQGAAAAPPATDPSERAFLAANGQAMTRMMAGMSLPPSGDVDHDFVAMMIAHHQGAIDMATLELRYGHNEQLRRIAQEIVVTQQQEIPAMRRALGQPGRDAGVPAPKPSTPHQDPSMVMKK